MSDEIKNTRADRGAWLVCVLAVVLVCVLQHMSYDFSAGVTAAGFLARRIRTQLYGCGFTLMAISLMAFVTGRLAASCLTGSVFCALFSLVNHYVTLYSGHPFLLSMIAQAGTALNVAGRYSFSPDGTVAVILAIFLLNVCLCFLIKKRAESVSRLRNKKFVRAAGLCCAVLMTFCVGLRTYKKARMGHTYNTDDWLSDQGYIVWTLTDSNYGSKSPLRIPPGYGADEVRKLAAVKTRGARPAKLPDIVLILNETLFDLRRYTDIETDVPYLANWYAAKNAFHGHALSPRAFGATNDSEFELLTSHPLYLATRSALMACMKMDGVHSVAKYLSSLGYYTLAAHSCTPKCYNRAIALPALGFEHMKYYDDFTEHVKYGRRQETDAANYRDMIRWYERAGEGPRFFYLLTFQNHGGYRQNDSSLDTVHSLTDFGKTTSLVNEYLTSIRMSDEALADLLKYFESVERPALVCVVGDHGPYFCPNLKKFSSDDLSAREVPLMIWANPAFGSLNVESAPAVSMTDVVPLLRAAGLPLSPYYEYLLDVARDIPIRERDGTYIRADGAQGRFEPGDENYSRLLPLYSAAYADLAGECADLRDTVFSPPAGGAQ